MASVKIEYKPSKNQKEPETFEGAEINTSQSAKQPFFVLDVYGPGNRVKPIDRFYIAKAMVAKITEHRNV